MKIKWKYEDGEWICYLGTKRKAKCVNYWTHGMPSYDEFWIKNRLVATHHPYRDRYNADMAVEQFLLIDGSWQYEDNMQETDVRVVLEETDVFQPITKAEDMVWLLRGKKKQKVC